MSEAGVLDRNPGQPAAEAIHVEDLHKKFGTLHVLKGVSLSAQRRRRRRHHRRQRFGQVDAVALHQLLGKPDERH